MDEGRGQGDVEAAVSKVVLDVGCVVIVVGVGVGVGFVRRSYWAC